MSRLNLIVVLALSSLAVVLASVEVIEEPINSLSLEGYFLPAACTPGNSDSACKPVALSGPNVSIFHGDGTCSFLYVQCGLDGLAVTLLSPGHVTEAYLTWLGTKQPYPAPRPKQCSSYRQSPAQEASQMTPSKKASYVNNECDTELTVIGADEYFTNVINIVEFLEVQQLKKPSVYLLSHTHVTVKCCNVVAQDPSDCVGVDDVVPPVLVPLIDCDDKVFELECTENRESELYECKVKLNGTQVLGDPRLKYSIHSCYASVAGSDKIPLVSSDAVTGPTSSAALEVSPVCLQNPADEASRAVYFFSAPYFQFDGQSSGLVGVHDVSISCSVEVFETTTRPDTTKEPACPTTLKAF